MMKKFENKIAVITGGNSGMGYGTAKLLKELGASHREDIAVLKSHKDFLLARDMTSMAFLYLILAGIPILFFAKAPLVYYYIVFLILQYLILVRVGQNKGKAFVTNVLAIESTK